MQLLKAIWLAKAAHKGQTDKGGKDYFQHCKAVARKCWRYTDKVVAYLHDTVEDTWVTISLLEDFGFSKKVIDAVIAITHRKTLDYPTYLKIVKTNKIATRVKIADMKHNSDLKRIPNPSEVDYKRVEKYQRGIKFLKWKS